MEKRHSRDNGQEAIDFPGKSRNLWKAQKKDSKQQNVNNRM